MDPKTQIKSAIQIPQREETFPVQEQEIFPVRDLSDQSPPLRFAAAQYRWGASRPAAHILAEQLADQQASLAIAAPVFVP